MKEHAPISLNIPGLPSPVAIFAHGNHDRFVSRQIRESGLWEPFETALVLEFLEAGSVFVDVGANIGYFSMIAACLVGDQGRVIAFEPDPANMGLLNASSAWNGYQSRIVAVEGGLSTVDDKGRLYLSEDNMGDHQIYPGENRRDSLEIRLYNGSDFLRQQLAHLDLLKVDTQGSEYDVMAGLMPLLRAQAKTPRIIIELTPLSLREAGASGRQLIELLATLDSPFWIIDHIEHRLVVSNAAELATWCDNVDSCEGDRGFMNILVGPGHLSGSEPSS